MSNSSHPAINISPTRSKKLRRSQEPTGTVPDASRANSDSFSFGQNLQELIKI